MGKLRQQVALKDVRFFAFHGFYPEEQMIGSVFYLDLETEFDCELNLNDDLAETVNYERLFSLAKKEMQIPRKLIETVAQAILAQVIIEFTQVQTARISIRKMNPPLAGEVGHSQVSLNYTR